MHANSRSIALSVLALSTVAVIAAAWGGRHKGGTPAVTPTPTPTPAPVISSVTPGSARPGAVIVVAGSHFGATQGASTVSFGGVAGVPSQWSDNSISVPVPPASALGAGDEPVTVVTSGGTSNVVPFVVLLPPAFYVKNATTPDSISAYAIDGVGNIGALSGSPYLLGGNPAGFGGDASSLWVNPHTRRVYATVNNSVAEFAIDDSAGKLVAVAGSPFATGTTTNYGVTTNPEGTLVFVTGNGSDAVAVLAVGSSGALTPIAGSPFSTQSGGGPDSSALSADGHYLFTNLETTHMVERFSVATNGTLMVLGSNGWPSNFYFQVKSHPSINALYVGGAINHVNGYSINPGNGDLTQLPGAPWSVPSSMTTTISADGKRLYTSAYNTGDIAGFDIGANGVLTPLSWSPHAAGLTFGTVIDLSADGKFLVAVEQQGVSKIHVYGLASNGAPTEIGSGTLLGVIAPSPEHVAFGR